MEIGGHPEFRKENNKLQVSHVTGVRIQNSLFIFKNQNREDQWKWYNAELFQTLEGILLAVEGDFEYWCYVEKNCIVWRKACRADKIPMCNNNQKLIAGDLSSTLHYKQALSFKAFAFLLIESLPVNFTCSFSRFLWI